MKFTYVLGHKRNCLSCCFIGQSSYVLSLPSSLLTSAGQLNPVFCQIIVPELSTSMTRPLCCSAISVLPLASRSASHGLLNPVICQTIVPELSTSITRPLPACVISVLPLASLSTSTGRFNSVFCQTIVQI